MDELLNCKVFFYAWKGSEKEVSQCNVFFMERHVTTFRHLELQVTINNLVWQQINSRQYSTFAIELFGLVQVASIASYGTLQGKD